MKFDYVIGNPPYQEEAESESTSNGQKPRKNIFQHFQIQADKIAKDISGWKMDASIWERIETVWKRPNK